MKKLWLIVAALVVVVLAGGAFAVWYFVLDDDAPPEAALPEREQPASTTDASGGATDSAADGTWTVKRGEGVFVGYRVEELFANETLKKTAAGRTPAVHGRVTLDGSNVTEGEFTADLTRLDSDQDRRDNYLHHSSLETDTFPEAKFVLTTPIDLGAIPDVGATVTVTANGDLTLHGVTKAVELQLEARWNGDVIDVAGQLPVLFADYDIEKPSVPFLSTDDHGTMELVLTFVRA
jgi:polyisoprenoid-binding protein YceI